MSHFFFSRATENPIVGSRISILEKSIYIQKCNYLMGVVSTSAVFLLFILTIALSLPIE